MRTTQIRSAVAAVLAGALMAVASPAVAHAQSSQDSEWAPVPLSTLRTAAAAGYGLGNYKSGKFLQPAGGSTANGATIVQQTGNQAVLAQHWILVPDGDYYSFENDASGRNLGIDGASTEAGAVAIQADGSSGTNQDWVLAVDSAYPANTFKLRNRKSGLCLGISGGSTANGAVAAQFACEGGAPNQGWGLFNQ
ncbi:RICIN domain-containing protein [Streptomyces sp. NBC_00038]|uniref:RICIN domain-containing protein n=1 Tax=Streptomyces sp. NBC_00038 TaxID=2903615 RepID=UPI0022528FD2|nr:RICIN domain-containing protein [Streptomyces sp. NBC_00038]MCX5559470.1 RICIN domain-containing protein [Streptomyces sp. NBC_00038]